MEGGLRETLISGTIVSNNEITEFEPMETQQLADEEETPEYNQTFEFAGIQSSAEKKDRNIFSSDKEVEDFKREQKKEELVNNEEEKEVIEETKETIGETKETIADPITLGHDEAIENPKRSASDVQQKNEYENESSFGCRDGSSSNVDQGTPESEAREEPLTVSNHSKVRSRLKKVESAGFTGISNQLGAASENPYADNGIDLEEDKDDSDPQDDVSKPERTINTVDMEAMNSEESEEDVEQYHMKTIFSWKKDKDKPRLTEYSNGPYLDSLKRLQESSQEAKRTRGKYKRLKKNLKNFDLFEILTSDREGRSEYREENKYGGTIPEFEGEGEGDYFSQKNSYPKMEKHSDKQNKDLASSEDYYSDNNDTAYYKNIQDKAMRLRKDGDKAKKSGKHLKKQQKEIHYKSKLKQYEVEMDDYYERYSKVNYSLCTKIQNEAAKVIQIQFRNYMIRKTSRLRREKAYRRNHRDMSTQTVESPFMRLMESMDQNDYFLTFMKYMYFNYVMYTAMRANANSNVNARN